MSMSSFFYIEIYNRKLGQWEKFDVYTRNWKDEIAPVDLWWWNGSHELFSILEFEESYDFPEFTALHKGLPMDVSNEMQKNSKIIVVMMRIGLLYQRFIGLI